MTTSEWGRVAEDGTVYVRTTDGERPVGQYPEGSPEEALAFFAKRYDELAGSVHLLEQRVKAGVVSPDEATESVRTSANRWPRRMPSATSPRCVGRLDSLLPVISQQRQVRRAERAERAAAAKTEKERLVSEAEKLAESNDWRNGANRLRAAARRVEGAAADRPRRRRRSCGGASRPRARRTPGAGRRTSPSRTRSVRAPGWSSSDSPRRPRRWRTRGSGVRPPAATAT